MATKHMRRCSRALAVRKVQIKITRRYHYMLIRKAKKKKNSGNTKCWQGWGETGSLIQCCWEFKILQGLPQWLRNLRADEGDPAGVIPDEGRSHVPWSN